ncbi:protein archease [Streptomyces sp. Ru71]|uniref:archease n=1 Tax=Streptomyces sp. Ru71 TaxID=2080746 RepID=UPI000CDD4CBC|nr:archease [Streptomyces sp. Ru71]POX50397.1 protein archease [Streptomyces sp. Ru71]
MVGDTGDDRLTRVQGGSGHRAVPHTADVRIEAWGANREDCLAEAVLGMVECFADVSRVRPTAVERLRVAGTGDDDLLAALLEEVVYRMEVHGRVPVDVEADAEDDELDVRLAVAELADVEITGAVPKGVSWHELHLGPGPYGWSCSVTIDA